MRDEAHQVVADGGARPTSKFSHFFAPAAPPVADAPGSPTQLRPSSSRSWFHARPRTSPGPRPSPFKTRSSVLSNDDVKRDSGFAPSTTARPSCADDGTVPDVPHVPRVPTIVVHDDAPRPSTAYQASELDRVRSLETSIPSGNLDELSVSNMDFSNRGSLMLGGKKMDALLRQRLSKRRSRDDMEEPVSPKGMPPATPKDRLPESPKGKPRVVSSSSAPSGRISSPPQASPPRPNTALPPGSTRSLAPRKNIPGTRVLSADETMLSKKVRSMYEHGDEKAAEWIVDGAESVITEEFQCPMPLDGDVLSVQRSRQSGVPRSWSTATISRPGSAIIREPNEVAGGIEDWEDIDGAEIDRYGFIVPKPVSSNQRDSLVTFEAPKLQRVSTQLQLASEAPRRKRTMHRAGSTTKSSRSTFASPPRRLSSRRSIRAESVYSAQSISSARSSNPFRYAANRLPHNRERRCVDEASDMLTLPPGLATIAEEREGGRAAMLMKRKEWQREEKWRKMGRLVGKGPNSGGMIFEFDTRSPKLIERTWKGIPDRWRATAWHAFLSASAKKNPESESDDELISSFYELQDEDCADDVQIDVDVPRTISHHIMFRRRYRGGQRLLFRVLHAMSLYLPETGYVQGMAALAATLLCYYNEETAFVMLVRLWKLRGLERLYQHGFTGLMEALEDFEKHWLAGGEIAKKLEELGIHYTAYGTRWYLTLFNYSIPFPAQLRVWDVFMLLGDSANCNPGAPESFNADLDVLHATSAALIDATREILLDSDFEVAMKTLTSWVPVKDEDLLMRVAKAEWKQRKRRGRMPSG
ncbi:uncharacterized protein K452DRAFT_6888 [Aplosporella prunicola CBS 121167]|uniref:Rab-GAP TBC domain-containing protein n=1 Tax=Aplosporella prunicola CBS 121167 TaxID=1176127 RepID=A0A6A6BTE8_9PEZI|nr:uncharacterized protein K452DRAFT_6888 [Aplosporella prunicola CBS 121167]KAF2147399.1 hypothetical protein K452DRAFT_6888 [Aplosporella prunicola CBS 121167]